MKYVYYEASSGMIKMITPLKETNPADPYIEVEDGDVEDILNGKASRLDFFVKPASLTSSTGKIVKVHRGEAKWKSINDWLFMIPQASEEPEFILKQDTTNKTVNIRLSSEASSWWQENQFFQKKEIPIAACTSADPHDMVWYKQIASKDLLAGVTFTYEGTDELRFYTHRYFESYLHE
jgi:hypothetical protein